MEETTPPFTVYPMPGATKVRVPIFATEATDAQHVTEGDMQLMGSVEVDVVKPRKGGCFFCGHISSNEYKIQLTFEFAAAEMQVKAYDVSNKCYVKCRVEFSSEAAASSCRVALPAAHAKA